MTTTHSNHCYIIGVDEAELLTLMGGWRQHSCIQLPVFENAVNPLTNETIHIPSDAIVERVFIDPWMGRQIGFVISHPSFPEVEHGVQIPRLSLYRIIVQRLDPGVDYSDTPVTV